MGQGDVDLNSFVRLPYSNRDVSQVSRFIIGQPLPKDLEDILDLMEGRASLFHVKLKSGEELLVKPYVSTAESDVISRLCDSEMSPVLGFNDHYFAEGRIRIPSIDRAIESKATFLDYVSGLFGRALYLLHSREIGYNGRFNNHVFADDITKKVKISNFSRARITQEPAALHVDVIAALMYLEALAQMHNIEDKTFFAAIRNFKSSYAIDDRSERVWNIASTYCLFVESSTLIGKALNMLLPPPPRIIYPASDHGNGGRPRPRF